MNKILLFLIAIFGIKSTFSQARLILNNGGIVNITNSAFLVIDNPATNAITRNTSGHIISEGEFNRVKWNIGTTNGTYVVPFGRGAAEYLPVSLTTSGAVGASGNLTFAMYGGNWLNSSYLPTGVTNFFNNGGGDASYTAIDRFWRIEPSGYTTKPALSNLIFTYRDIEHSVANNTILEANLMAQRYNSTTDEWDDYMPGSVTNTASNTNTVSTLPSSQLYTWWTLTDNRAPLPIELTIFQVKCDGDKTTIHWQTATEKNNQYFEVERSIDATNFTSILKVNSQNPNSISELNYSAVDPEPYNGKAYYRLKQVDLNGGYTYSSVVVVDCKSGNTTLPASVSVFPNPATDVITVDIKGLPGKKSIEVFNTLGQRMIDKIFIDENENSKQEINLSSFANASYLIRIDVGDELFQVIKFIKK